MQILPAIDLSQGQCVRLRQGLMEDKTVYGNDPVEMAQKLEAMGATMLHVVDLDGAIHGESENAITIMDMVKAINIPIQLGGGVRTTTDIQMRLNRWKVHRVVLGTVAYEKPELVEWAAKDFPGQIAVGIDAKDGYVAIKGWQEITDMTPIELAQEMRDAGVDTIISTDISKDGMLIGPNIEATVELAAKSGMDVIASGGVSCMDDLQKLADAGIPGVIVGKAMYDGKVDIKEAIRKWND